MKTLTAFLAIVLSIGQAVAQDPPSANAETASVKFRVLQSKWINLGDRSLTINRVLPPILPTQPVVAKNTNETEGEIMTKDDLASEKKQDVLIITATVYDRNVSEVRALVGQQEVKIFTNVDFNLLTGLSGIETDDTFYKLMLGVENKTRADVAALDETAVKQGLQERKMKRIPEPESYSKNRSELSLVNGEDSQEPSEEVLKAFDALFAFYDSNRGRLADDYITREAAEVEREQWFNEHPPQIKDTVINYWLGQGATTIVDKRSMGGAR